MAVEDILYIEERIKLDKQIAYFMGWRIDNSFPDKGKVWRSPQGDIELDTTFKFLSDWNKLMEVFEAVNAIEDYSVSIQPGYCSIYYQGMLEWEAPHKESALITQEAVYKCLAGFIVSYNELQRTNGL